MEHQQLKVKLTYLYAFCKNDHYQQSRDLRTVTPDENASPGPALRFINDDGGDLTLYQWLLPRHSLQLSRRLP